VRKQKKIILFNKPFGVLCQFSPSAGRTTLADFIEVPRIYAAGRLDMNSEGLLVLTDDGALQHRLSDPRHKLEKIYWVQVERLPEREALDCMRRGVDLDGRMTLPAKLKEIAPPDGLWPRNPPIRFRQNVPTAWLDIRIREGRNRQIRRMTAAVGHPTLRLVRYAVGPYNLNGLPPGKWRRVGDR
jgi:23S rRNA pseudouridine2457 synthase